MKQDSSTLSWNAMGDEWLTLAQTGESRMRFIMPHMLRYMGDVRGLHILDLGCGEGGYSRAMSAMGAFVTAVDCSAAAIRYAQEQAQREGLTITHNLRNSNDLFGIPDASFDVVLSSMMLMDVEDLAGTLREAVRVLKPGGRVFVSMLHPCFDGNHERGIGRQGQGESREVVVKNYFEPREWDAPLPNGTTSVIWRHRTLSEYVKAFLAAGLTIADMHEPRATQEEAENFRSLTMIRRIPLFLYWELRKISC
ncbi:MAG: methyltransferase domain-containing protein [Clostridia bacterium]|nr:methyltransferase domain-containing protein [Clostridia bacterium]